MTDSPQNKAILIVQIGPVQRFIEQARSTRDLWSGSFLISLMAAHVANRIAHVCGEKSLVFPSTDENPMFLRLKNGDSAERLNGLEIPNFPNRLLAVVPADFHPEADVIGPVFRDENSVWRKIASECLEDFKRGVPTLESWQEALWAGQVGRFWQIAWQLWPFSETTADRLASIGVDERNSSGWAGHYALASHRLDARRHVREFAAAPLAGRKDERSHQKDALSGVEEAVLTRELAASMRRQPYVREFRKKDPLGAPNIIKRIAPRVCYGSFGVPREALRFESVPAVAAAAWISHLIAACVPRSRVAQAVERFARQAAEFCQNHAGEADLDSAFDNCREWQGDAAKWVASAPPDLFFEPSWDEAVSVTTGEAAASAQKARAALGRLCGIDEVAGGPSRYFCVLSMDGDDIGRWVSGEKFEKGTFSQETHRDFSARLSNFALHAVGPIIAHFHGCLVYAGGDDLLAMLPVENALECAVAIEAAFRGSPALAEMLPEIFDPCEEGSIQPRGSSARKVPGPRAGISAGLAYAHIKSPLQDAVGAARAALEQAKTVDDKGAVGVALLKRSGSISEFAFKFRSNAMALLQFLGSTEGCRRSFGNPKPPPVSSRFPHAVCRIFERYFPKDHRNASETLGFRHLMLREITHHAGRMIDKDVNPSASRDKFLDLARETLREIDDANLPLSTFADLLNLESFLGRAE